MTGEEKRGITKILLVVIIFAVAVFGIFNLYWYFGHAATYFKMADRLERYQREDGTSGVYYAKEVDDYRILLKMPAYLGYGGFVSIAPKDGQIIFMDHDGNEIGSNGLTIVLYIWPQKNGEYKYGVDMDNGQDLWIQAYIDEEIKVDITKYPEDVAENYQELLDEHRNEIANMLTIGKETLGIE